VLVFFVRMAHHYYWCSRHAVLQLKRHHLFHRCRFCRVGRLDVRCRHGYLIDWHATRSMDASQWRNLNREIITNFIFRKSFDIWLLWTGGTIVALDEKRKKNLKSIFDEIELGLYQCFMVWLRWKKKPYVHQKWAKSCF